MGNKTFFNWSSGKDSAFALYHLLQDKNYSVEYLLTTVSEHSDRVSMHGLRRELLLQQTEAIGIPCGTVELPEQVTDMAYEARMERKLKELKAEGFEWAAYGDIFLEDLRKYRERLLRSSAVKAVFPLWRKDTERLLYEFIDSGFKAIVICVDAALLDRSFTGRCIDRDFIKELPKGIDPCGENGEFHTFCFDAPIFSKAVKFLTGDTVFKEYGNGQYKSGFWFCDLLPENRIPLGASEKQ